ncbi:unnamed protein product [Schistosoma turkestanicum]|nr:unnamed protein product [Schistosoma turkestanicum]
MCDNNSDLRNFVLENDCNFAVDNVDFKTKETILEKCRKILEDHTVCELYTCLCCLRILTRDDILRKELTSELFLSRIFKYAFEYHSNPEYSKITLEALKSLSNIVFKESCVINQLKSMGFIKTALESVNILITNGDKEKLLLCLKLLFLVTALDSASRQDLIKFNALQMLLKVVKLKISKTIDSDVAAEALKVVYNILYSTRDEDVTTELGDDIRNLVVMLRCILQDPMLDQSNNYALASQVINVLNIIPKHLYKYLLDEASGDHVVDKLSKGSASVDETDKMSSIEFLITFLHSQLKLDASKESETASDLRTDERICPILNCLTRASKSNRQIRKFCRLKVLPYLGKDVTRLPEDGDSIRNYLCKLLTNPVQIVGESAAIIYLCTLQGKHWTSSEIHRFWQFCWISRTSCFTWETIKS